MLFDSSLQAEDIITKLIFDGHLTPRELCIHAYMNKFHVALS